MAIKLKVVKSFAGAPEGQLKTLAGLGLRKFGQERLLKDTPAIRGMVVKVRHLVSLEEVSGDAPARARRKPRKIVRRDRARADAAKADANV